MSESSRQESTEQLIAGKQKAAENSLDNPQSDESTEDTFDSASAAVAPSHQNTQDSPPSEHFDFDKFTTRMRQPSAAPLLYAIRRFIREFRERPLTAKEQVFAYHSFFDYLLDKIETNGSFADADVGELANAKEGLEYLLMTQLYHTAFAPALSDDTIKDERLQKKMSLHAWLELSHLDITLTDQEAEQGNLALALEAFRETEQFKTPRDKLICLTNGCCLLSLLANSSVATNQSSEEACEAATSSADAFLSLLIYGLVKAAPDRLASNFAYIQRYRDPSQLNTGSAAYYFTNLQAAITFIESRLSKDTLTIEDAEYDRMVEMQVARLNAETVLAEEYAHESGAMGKAALLDDSPLGQAKRVAEAVKNSVVVTKGIGYLQRFMGEADAAIKKALESDPEENDESVGDPRQPAQSIPSLSPVDPEKARKEEEEFQLQLALALSLSEHDLKDDAALPAAAPKGQAPRAATE